MQTTVSRSMVTDHDKFNVLTFRYAVCKKGMKGKLNNLVIQLRKNCNHPDLLESAYDESCMPKFNIW